MPMPYDSETFLNEPSEGTEELKESADDLSKKDLLEKARELDIEGRSNMTKDELAEAVQQAEG